MFAGTDGCRTRDLKIVGDRCLLKVRVCKLGLLELLLINAVIKE
jgi:hypothetical protein